MYDSNYSPIQYLLLVLVPLLFFAGAKTTYEAEIIPEVVYASVIQKETIATAEEPAVVEVSQGNPLCFCVKTVRTYIPELPRQHAEDFVPNTYPFAGAVAIYDYGKYKHIGFIESIEEKGFWELGSNIEPCKPYRRFVEWGDVNLIGFYKSDII